MLHDSFYMSLGEDQEVLEMEGGNARTYNNVNVFNATEL